MWQKLNVYSDQLEQSTNICRQVTAIRLLAQLLFNVSAVDSAPSVGSALS